MPQETKGQRIVVSVLGRDRVGIIAGVAGTLAEHNANILDISQTILQGMFTMVMMVDISACNVDFNRLKDLLDKKGRELGVRIHAQREEAFSFMHRL